jgi:hypothetical protein
MFYVAIPYLGTQKAELRAFKMVNAQKFWAK